MRTFCLLALAGMAAAQPADRLAGFRNISQERLRTDLKFLASPALEGRLSLHRGSEVAIEWAARIPGARDGSVEIRPIVDFTQA